LDKDIRVIAEKCSKFQEVDASELPRLRTYVENFIDRDWLATRLEEYKAWAKNNSDPVLQHNFLHRPIGFNMLVSAIWAAHYWEREHQSDASFQPRMGAIRLMNIACSLAVLELHAEQSLDFAAREYLKQRLQSNEDLWGIIHELNTFAFFIRQGAIVEPNFLKRASVEDITVDWRGTVIPVQCKNMRAGTGRHISQEVFINLASYIVLDMRKAKKSLIIKIGVTGEKKIPNEDIDFLRSQVKIYAGQTIAPVLVNNKERTYSIIGQQLSNQFKETLPEELYFRMVISEPEVGSGKYKPVAIVGIESNPIETPLNSLSSTIMKGVKQFQGDKPGILAIYYTDPVKDFNALCPSPQTMQLYISERLAPFSHIGAVILSSEPNYLGPVTSKAGKTYIYYRQPWAFPKDFLQDNP
jgi:hypothetical protein